MTPKIINPYTFFQKTKNNSSLATLPSKSNSLVKNINNNRLFKLIKDGTNYGLHLPNYLGWTCYLAHLWLNKSPNKASSENKPTNSAILSEVKKKLILTS